MLKKPILMSFLLLSQTLFGLNAQEVNGKDKKSVNLKSLIEVVEKKYGYSFMFSNSDIDVNTLVAYDEQAGNLETLLKNALGNSGVSYEISGKRVLLKKARKGTQENEVKGLIRDEQGNALAGVSISTLKSGKNTVTDRNGAFTIEVDGNERLKISYVGYLDQEVSASAGKYLNITLVLGNEELEEVVVIGYGTLKKSDVTGAITTIDAKDLAKRATSNPVEALQGMAAGVNVQKNSGIAGAGMQVKIRGVNTFGSNDPLYIIDGFPGSISNVNPNDIESMEILKDGAAAAIYGSVAANGVVIVTTKAGKSGKVLVDINSFANVTSTANRLEVLDANGYVKLHRQMYEENNKYSSAPVALPDYINNPGTANTDWQDAVFRKGVNTAHSVAVRGGFEDTRYSLSANLGNDKGVVIANNFKKENVRMKLSTRKNIFTIEGNMAYTNSKYQGPNFNLKEAYMISPLVPIYDDKQSGGFGLTNWGGIPNNVNVVADEYFKTSWSKNQEFAGNAFVNVDIWKGLTFKTSYAFNGINNQKYYHTPAFTSDEKNPYEYPYYSEERSYWQEQVVDNLLNYQADFDKHSINALLGTSLTLQESNWNAIGVEGKNIVYSVENGGLVTKEVAEGFLDPYFMTIDAGRGGTYSGTGSKYQYNRFSVFGRINYTYANRYLLQFTLRRDGSSKFGPDNRYGNFPSLALGWKIDEEEFFPKGGLVNQLKLRGSWGKLGNEAALRYYDHQALIYSDNSLVRGYVRGGGNPWPGSIATNLENREIGWETTVSQNIGADFGLFNNTLKGAINYYSNTTEDLLITKKIAPSSGLVDPVLNVGKIRNSGFELELKYTNQNNPFAYNVGVNLATLKNKVISLGGEDQTLYGVGLKFGSEHFPNQTRIGSPIGGFFLYQTDGIFQNMDEVNNYVNADGKLLQPNAKPGDIRFVDSDGNGSINDDDKQYSGTGLPKLEVGITLGASYKGFDMSALLGSGWGHKLYNGNRYFFEAMSSGSNFLSSTLNAWTENNRDTDVPRAVLGDPNGNSRESTRFLEAGDFIRLRQIQLGYTLPKHVLGAIKSENLRFYISGQNLFTWTKYNGIDPEFGSSGVLSAGVDRYIFPFTKSYTLGLQFLF
ncbi:SusC/RagA family TonB-linked outer membrane protein [Sphingobacterium yanglingense]|uniref:TonB-linked SusC/RagA family outer membrane protein n=1 Tax=Sphingobacterium yanglingense TaxID=1437280 RepID=A0A4R6WIH6_9SPHI|nr:TonB-dependent receptor [Sphingobacterium yanglingense]TDQ77386.1 TonB-linked SusC/RagA family outer membrane protein [Sphingobacterium yanglingense]